MCDFFPDVFACLQAEFLGLDLKNRPSLSKHFSGSAPGHNLILLIRLKLQIREGEGPGSYFLHSMDLQCMDFFAEFFGLDLKNRPFFASSLSKYFSGSAPGHNLILLIRPKLQIREGEGCYFLHFMDFQYVIFADALI